MEEEGVERFEVKGCGRWGWGNKGDGLEGWEELTW